MLAHYARSPGATTAVLLALFLLPGLACASSALLQVQVNAADTGAPLEDVVVTVTLPSARLPVEDIRPAAIMEQIDQQFDPQLLIIKTGTAVEFPNRDHTRHHVYSFSNARTFEIRLYNGLPPEPVVFEKAGPVILGCNIHDQMRASIYVTDADFWQRTDANGQAGLNIPGTESPITLEFWHSRLRGEAITRVIEGPVPETLIVSLDVRPMLPRLRATESRFQQRFDQLMK